MGQPVDKLTIKGLKSIRALEELELRNLNVLIGANGSGKTNFVSFFSLLRSIVNQELQLTVAKAGGADAHLFLGPKVTKQVEVRLWFGANGYEFVLEPTQRNRLVFSDETVHFGEYLDCLGIGHKEAKLKDAKDKPGHTARRGVPWYVFDALLSWVVYHFHDTSDTAAVRRMSTTRDYEKFRPDAGNLAAFLLRLRRKRAKAYKLIRDTVRLAAPFFDDFKLRPERNGADTAVQLEWTQKGSDYPFHPSQLSDGTLRFICLATALLQPNPPSTILLDEPELGL
ncbi:MAG: AAA family ATPase, partial [Phycisphaerae bacterium]